ncbi:uncharacterized protein BO80DRAFT_438912 [Aspergillus ibericus CBS 121593]|uniref:Uncharacterized protein n=1 Tax=Aspergillus ibericus CBS 121593 TaxID=1448316 RepID=A0A395GL23_9EURO|nr:hypothetical protein BO80DRAFT_438912 [Aspergillus ibericus CBS 121593]RAK96042.1 hypothetical protein BO80DRAFT_438912 [Aspergillus ibericus CBS 121593]
MASRSGQSSRSNQSAANDRCDQTKYPGIAYTTYYVNSIQRSNANMAGCFGFTWASSVHTLFFSDPVTQPLFDEWVEYRTYLKGVIGRNKEFKVDGPKLFERYRDPRLEAVLDAPGPPKIGAGDLIRKHNIVILGVLWFVHQLVKRKRYLFPRSRVAPGSDGRDRVVLLDPYDLLHGWKLLSRKMYNLEERDGPSAPATPPTWCDCELHHIAAVVTDAMVEETGEVSDETDVADDEKDVNYETESVVYTTEEMSLGSDNASDPPLSKKEGKKRKEKMSKEKKKQEKQRKGKEKERDKEGEENIWDQSYNLKLFGEPSEEPETPQENIWDTDDCNELFGITPKKDGADK